MKQLQIITGGKNRNIENFNVIFLRQLMSFAAEIIYIICRGFLSIVYSIFNELSIWIKSV